MWIPDSVPLGAEAKKVLVDAELEARELGHDIVRTCHLLLALTGTPVRGVPVLENLGINRDAVRAVIQNLRLRSSFQFRQPAKQEPPGVAKPGRGVLRRGARRPAISPPSTENPVADNSCTEWGGAHQSRLPRSRQLAAVIDKACEEAYVAGRTHATPYDLLVVLTWGVASPNTSDEVLGRLGRSTLWVHNQVVRRRLEPRDYEIARRIRHMDDATGASAG
jgi:hypothetical protein